jgi:hypothetical protein
MDMPLGLPVGARLRVPAYATHAWYDTVERTWQHGAAYTSTPTAPQVQTIVVSRRGLASGVNVGVDDYKRYISATLASSAVVLPLRTSALNMMSRHKTADDSSEVAAQIDQHTTFVMDVRSIHDYDVLTVANERQIEFCRLFEEWLSLLAGPRYGCTRRRVVLIACCPVAVPSFVHTRAMWTFTATPDLVEMPRLVEVPAWTGHPPIPWFTPILEQIVGTPHGPRVVHVWTREAPSAPLGQFLATLRTSNPRAVVPLHDFKSVNDLMLAKSVSSWESLQRDTRLWVCDWRYCSGHMQQLKDIKLCLRQLLSLNCSAQVLVVTNWPLSVKRGDLLFPNNGGVAEWNLVGENLRYELPELEGDAPVYPVAPMGESDAHSTTSTAMLPEPVDADEEDMSWLV